MEHTKEPWIAIEQDRGFHELIITTQSRINSSVGEICGMNIHFRNPMGDEQKANARRIVACVNACRGIRTEALEHRVHLLAAEDDTISLLNAQLTTERASLFAESQRKQQLWQQVEELVSVLERAVNEAVADDLDGWFTAARAVIQKVRGGE